MGSSESVQSRKLSRIGSGESIIQSKREAESVWKEGGDERGSDVGSEEMKRISRRGSQESLPVSEVDREDVTNREEVVSIPVSTHMDRYFQE